jgi:hypothetical protein
MTEYGRLIDHVGRIVPAEGDQTHYDHIISEHIREPDLYITTEYYEAQGSARTLVNPTANALGEAARTAHAQRIAAPPELNGQDRPALRAYHQSIVDDYTARPPRRTYTPPAAQ